jgi:hypothetical protein
MEKLDGLTQWKCGHGHVLGVVRRMPVSADGRTVYATRLMLFRQAIDPKVGASQDGDVIAVIEGTTLDVRCSIPGCKATRTWWIGEAGMERLLERMVK